MPTMEAVRIHQFGPPTVLHEEPVSRPEPGPGEMLVRVKAASVNPVDFKMRSGKYPSTTEKDLPLILGRDLSGVVEAVGAAPTGFAVGDEVIVFLGRDRGSYAEYVRVKPEEAAPKPSNLDFVAAAAVPLAAVTAWQGLFDQGQLRAGQRVLIHGAAGGVGHFAVQFAKIAGATVLTTASDKDRQFLEGLGADLVIDHHTQRFDELIDEPVDLVFDLIGGETMERSFKLIAKNGRLVTSVGHPSNALAETYGITASRYMAEPDSGELRHIADLIEAGDVVPHIAKVYDLADAADAHAELEQTHIQGKIVLRAA